MNADHLLHEDMERFTKHELLLLLTAFLAAMVIRQLIHVRLFPDSLQYLTFARNVVAGIHNNGDISFARYYWSPLYPHLVALFSLGNTDPLHLVAVGRQLSIFAGALLIFPLYFLGRKFYGRTAAGFTTCCMAFLPEGIYYAGAILTESLATLFLTTSLFLTWYITATRPDAPGEWKKYGLAGFLLGVSLGLTFLARHALLGYLILILLWIACNSLTMKPAAAGARLKRDLLPILFLLTGFLLTTLPQVLYLHAETGGWALTASQTGSFVKSRMAQEGQDDRYTADYEAQHAELTPDGRKFLWEAAAKESMTSLILQHPETYLKSYWATVRRGYLADTYPLPYPAIVLIMSLAGIIGLLARKSFRKLFFCLWGFGGYYLFLALFFNMRDRYMFPAYPLLLLAAGIGAAEILRTADAVSKKTWRPVNDTILQGILYCTIIGTLLPSSIQLIGKQNEMANNDTVYRLGRDIAEKIDKQAVMFARSPSVPFFAGAAFSTVPYAPLDDTIRFARTRGVDYWEVSTSYIPGLRPQFISLLNPWTGHPGLQPVAVYGTNPANILIIYRILPDSG